MIEILEAVNHAETQRSSAPERLEILELCPICNSKSVKALLSAPDRFHLLRQMYRLDRCSGCGAVWLYDPPSPSEMGQHYTADYHNAIMLAGEGSVTERWKHQRQVIAKHKSGGKVLDAGCSSGAFLSTMMGSDWTLYGIEMEDSTAEKARTRTGAEVFVGDAVDAPFGPNTFDVITTFDVLEHVYSPPEFLAKVFEWLKPGGIYYASMPNIASWEARLFGDHWFGLELPRHITHFSPRSLRCLMKQVGLEEVSIGTPPESYVERSADYVLSTLLGKAGFSPTPQATPKRRGFMARAIRKAIRMMVLSPLAHIAALTGSGPCVEIVFRKPLPAENISQ